jgi:hypothetical protein
VKYLRVNIEGCVQGCCNDPVYSSLDPLTEYSEKDLLAIGQDMANEVHSWGYDVVDEDEVPEGYR